MFAERRLRNIQPQRRLSEVHLLRYHAEIVQQAEVNSAGIGQWLGLFDADDRLLGLPIYR